MASESRSDEEQRVSEESAALLEMSKKLFSFDELQAEIEALRSNPPPYVNDIGHLKVPTTVCGTKRDLLLVNDGVWDICMYISGSDRNPHYDFPFRVALRFDRSWPTVPPDVKFNGVMYHSLTDDDGSMLSPFYKAIPRGDNAVCTVEAVVAFVRLFLEDALSCLGVDPETTNPRFLKHFQSMQKQSLDRITTIKNYSAMALHSELFEFPVRMREEWFHPAFWEAHQANTAEAWRTLLHEEMQNEVFSFPIFTLDFCEVLLAEVFNFYASGLPVRRPNSMNNYGIILNEIGLEPFITELQKILQPIGECLFPGAGHVWDGHHCFIVRYREGEDLGLDMHTDDSDVTFNTCLGLDFDGAGLQFCGVLGEENHRKHTYTYQHKKGSCVVHLGRKRHGADDISRGERLNIILWNHSSTYRSSSEYNDPPYNKEIGPPDEVCVSYTHDRDYGVFKEYPKGKEEHKGQGWCPPKKFEYEGFEVDFAPVVCHSCEDSEE